MAIRSAFFNSVDGDRSYDASRFAEFFASFIGNGIFPNPSTGMQVISNSNMTVSVLDGIGWINGYIAINEGNTILTLATADGVQNRIDRIVLRYGTVEREITLEVKQGELAMSPVAPPVTRNSDYYELALADVYVGGGNINVLQQDITDLRLDTSLCGIVHALIDQVDTTTIFNQYVAWLNTKQAEFNTFQTTSQTAFNTQTNNNQSIFNTQKTANQATFDASITSFTTSFNTWFDTLVYTLSGDVAGNLFNLISNKVDKDGNKVLSTYDYNLEAKTKVDAIPENPEYTDTVYKHPGTGTNPHGTTKADLNLDNVTNNAQVKKRASSTIGNIPTWDVSTGDSLGTGYSVETVLTGATTALARADAIKGYIDSAVENRVSSDQNRVIHVSSANADASLMANGDIWIKYE